MRTGSTIAHEGAQRGPPGFGVRRPSGVLSDMQLRMDVAPTLDPAKQPRSFWAEGFLKERWLDLGLTSRRHPLRDQSFNRRRQVRAKLVEQTAASIL